MEEKEYVKVTQDGIARLIHGKTPDKIAGLYTDGLESCIALIFFGDKGITLIHDTGKIADNIILNEYRLVGKIDFWTCAINPNHKEDYQAYINRLQKLGIPKEKYKHPQKSEFYFANQGFLSVNRDKKFDFKNKPQKILVPSNEDKRHRINIFNNFFSKYRAFHIEGDLQFDGNNFLDDCPLLVLSVREMRDIAVNNNNPLSMLGSLKYYLTKYEPDLLKEIEAEENLEELARIEKYKNSMMTIDIKTIAVNLNRKWGLNLDDNPEYKNSTAIQASNSPIHKPFPNFQEIKSILKQITPDKEWGLSISKNTAWLKVNNDIEAQNIITHFKKCGFENIVKMKEKKTDELFVSINSLSDFSKKIEIIKISSVKSPSLH